MAGFFIHGGTMAAVETGAAYTMGGAIYTGAVVLGVPLPVALMAALGALVAVSNSDRVAFSRAALYASFLTFAMALGLGLFGGYALAWAVARVLDDAPFLVLHALIALIVAAYGQSRLLPKVLGMLERKIDAGGM